MSQKSALGGQMLFLLFLMYNVKCTCFHINVFWRQGLYQKLIYEYILHLVVFLKPCVTILARKILDFIVRLVRLWMISVICPLRLVGLPRANCDMYSASYLFISWLGYNTENVWKYLNFLDYFNDNYVIYIHWVSL